MSDNIMCRVLRPLWHRGRSYPAGETFSATAREAQSVLESGRGELVRAEDLPRVRAAAQADTAQALKTAGRPWHARSEADGGPWRPA
jgi:hypothetical protein